MPIGSVAHPIGGRVLRAHLASVVEAGGADVGVAQPLLDLGDVGLVLQRVGRGGRAQAMHAEAVDRDAGLPGVVAGQRILFMGNFG